MTDQSMNDLLAECSDLADEVMRLINERRAARGEEPIPVTACEAGPRYRAPFPPRLRDTASEG
jgi:hypothetical protein